MDQLSQWITTIDEWVWGLPLILFILAVGILLSVRLKFVQIRQLPKAFRFTFQDETGVKGEISSFGSLCTALSATIGTGNIVGVATAIGIGGPGALFWMFVAAFLGMATKYAEGLLAVKYREVSKSGHTLGGAFYYIERGMGKKFKCLAKMFAFFGAGAGLLGVGTFAQVNGIAKAVEDFFDPQKTMTISLFGYSFSTIILITSLLVTLFVALVLIGGIKRISSVSEILVPFMTLTYLLCCFLTLGVNIKSIPNAVGEILSGAFTGTAAIGGFAGSTLRSAMQKGVARGIFSNEAGLGSATMVAAAAKTNWPAQQGLVSMLGTLIDTIVICSLTGLCIITSGAWHAEGIEGVLVTSKAFQTGFFFAPTVGQFLLMICLVFFAFTTILGWNYYGERCIEYLSHKKKKVVLIYRWLYILAVFVGPFLSVELVWNIADIFNGLMAFPNLIALVALNGVVVTESKKFFDHLKENSKDSLKTYAKKHIS